MKQEYVLTAVARTELGKGASRRLRRANQRVAGIIYGGKSQPQPIAIDKPAFYKYIEEESFFSSIITIDLDGNKEQVLIRDLQRHPYKPVLMHADFLRVRADEAITLTVPIHFINEEICIGIKEQNGILNILTSDVEIRCLPKDIPAYLELDIANLATGETLHLSDLITPAGVTLEELDQNADHNIALVTVSHASVEDESATDNNPANPPSES